jgi:porin
MSLKTSQMRLRGLAVSAIVLIAAVPALANTANDTISAEAFNLAASGAAFDLAASGAAFDLAASGSAKASEDSAIVVTEEAAAQAAAQAIAPAPAAATPPPADPVKLRLIASQFVDAPVSGSADGTLRYSGRIDGYFEIGGSVFGTDDSLTLKLRPEYTWGKTSNGVVGLIPGNTALFRPEGAGNFDLSASITHRWDTGVTLEVGKVNVLDISGALPIIASDGHHGFQNLGLALPPTAVVANTITGALLQVPTRNVIYRLWVFDPDSQYERTGFETGFESGVAFLSSATFIQRPGGKPGFYTFAVVGSTRDNFAVDILPRALTPPAGGTFGNESGELALQLSGYQYLGLYPEAPGKGWGVFARFQASMGDPTFLDYSGYVGISGNPRFRPQDRFGIAYFQYSLTDELADDIAFRLGIEDETGLEAFYTLGLTKGIEVTANVQVVDSAIVFRDTGIIVGARLTTGF